MQLQEFGEAKLLQRLQAFCPAALVGDDAAVLAMPPDRELVITADMLVDDVHFSDRTTSPQDVGWRAIAVNLSDLAAMAAMPIGVTISLGLPPDTPVAWIEQLYEGATACLAMSAAQVGLSAIPIVGGDVCRSPVRTVSISAFGAVRSGQAIRRNAAQPGDLILTTGGHGWSRWGLDLLLDAATESMSREWSELELRAIAAHQRPQPRLDWLDSIAALFQKTAHLSCPVRIAGMDSSDGLADAIVQICHASGVGAILDLDHLPGLLEVPGFERDRALNWTLYGGEDFELVLCLAPQWTHWLVAQEPSPLRNARVIGRVTAELGCFVQDATDAIVHRIDRQQSFQHF